jgi:hypothetical protein
MERSLGYILHIAAEADLSSNHTHFCDLVPEWQLPQSRMLEVTCFCTHTAGLVRVREGYVRRLILDSREVHKVCSQKATNN